MREYIVNKPKQLEEIIDKIEDKDKKRELEKIKEEIEFFLYTVLDNWK